HSIAAVLHRKQQKIAPVLLRRKRNQTIRIAAVVHRKQHSIAAVLHRKQQRIAPVRLRRRRNQLQCRGKSRKSRRVEPNDVVAPFLNAPATYSPGRPGESETAQQDTTAPQAETAPLRRSNVCYAHKRLLKDRAFMCAFFSSSPIPAEKFSCSGEGQSGPG